MTLTIRVRESEKSPILFEKSFDKIDEFQKVLDLSNKHASGIDIDEAMLFPVRTNNFHNFCKDFFLPNVVNCALKSRDLAEKIILSIIFIFLDIFTFPIRVFTCVPRYFYNLAHPKEAHLFYQYLIENGVEAKKLEAGQVYLETESVAGLGELTTYHCARNLVNFIAIPKRDVPDACYNEGAIKAHKPVEIEELA
jgi:hypothetical protein